MSIRLLLLPLLLTPAMGCSKQSADASVPPSPVNPSGSSDVEVRASPVTDESTAMALLVRAAADPAALEAAIESGQGLVWYSMGEPGADNPDEWAFNEHLCGSAVAARLPEVGELASEVVEGLDEPGECSLREDTIVCARPGTHNVSELEFTFSRIGGESYWLTSVASLGAPPMGDESADREYNASVDAAEAQIATSRAAGCPAE